MTKIVTLETLAQAYAELYPNEVGERGVMSLYHPLGNWLNAFRREPEKKIGMSNWYGKVTRALFKVLELKLPKTKKAALELLADLPKPSAEDIEAEMLLRARASVLEGDWLTAEAMEAKLGATGLAAHLPQWVTKGELFAIDRQDQTLYPVFCLDRARARPVPQLAEILRTLERDGWGAAYWFASVNSTLDGLCPQHLVAAVPERVLAAARDEALAIAAPHG